jgi:Fungal N-terminal domain of STAND proteins
MEIIGIASSVVGLVTFATNLIDAGHAFSTPFKEFREQVEAVKREIEQLWRLLIELQQLVDGLKTQDHAILPWQNSLLRLDEINACRNTLTKVEKLYNKSCPKEGKVVRNFSRRYVWPVAKKEIEEIMQRLERHKSTFILALNARGMYFLFPSHILTVQTSATQRDSSRNT